MAAAELPEFRTQGHECEEAAAPEVVGNVGKQDANGGRVGASGNSGCLHLRS